VPLEEPKEVPLVTRLEASAEHLFERGNQLYVNSFLAIARIAASQDLRKTFAAEDGGRTARVPDGRYTGEP